MSKFDAGTAVEPMTVDFSKWGGPVGDIPEPDGDAVDLFMSRLRNMYKEYRGLVNEGQKLVDAKDVDAANEFMEKIDWEQIHSRSEEQRMWVQELTQGYLEADMLKQCGPRVFAKFLNWLTGELSPKASESD